MTPTDPPGSPIPGSRYVRDYCTRCGEAIRVPWSPAGAYGATPCDDCTGRSSRRVRAQGDANDRRLTYLPEHGRKDAR